jgi:hypothetical protein
MEPGERDKIGYRRQTGKSFLTKTRLTTPAWQDLPGKICLARSAWQDLPDKICLTRPAR